MSGPAWAQDAQPPADGEYKDAYETIHKHCADKWPDDYDMRNYCEQQAVAALNALKERKSQFEGTQ